MYIALGIFAFIALVVIIIHNAIISRNNLVKQAWSDVLASQRQKLKVIPKITELLKEHQGFETSVLTEVTKLRSAIDKLSSNEIDTHKLGDVETISKRISGGITATFEAYPDLKTTELYKGVMSEISELEDNIAASIRIFNSNVARFNTSIEIFPSSLVNSLITHKSRIDEYSDSEAAEQIEYTPNL